MSDTPTRAGRAGIPSGALADAPPAPTVWLFDEHGALEGSQKARLSPNDWWPDKRAVWLLPPNATRVEPPAPQPGKVAVFDGERWSLVADHRGEVVYDKDTGQPHTIVAPGRVVEDDETAEPPPSPRHVWSDGGWALPLDVAKAGRIAEVAAELARREVAGFTYDGKAYQLNERSRAFINGRATRAGWVLSGVPGVDWPDDIGIIAADNSRTVLTAEQFRDFALEADRVVTVLQVRARDLKDAILAARDAEALAAIDVAAGWD
ncbi:MAG: DUF4376 domain-containing protein [Alphaproteobacteria bacterium]|nr:DUF4376 domain-containing protein [Alphaproteobacteria bacterium]MCW5739677.1 DUF4376 domain-containing protein [Alphaproteobacteria bacterium]